MLQKDVILKVIWSYAVLLIVFVLFATLTNINYIVLYVSYLVLSFVVERFYIFKGMLKEDISNYNSFRYSLGGLLIVFGICIALITF